MKLKFLFLPLLLTVTMMQEGCGSLVEAAYLFEENAVQGKQAEEIPIPTNVILVVGDGMGVAQVYSSVVAQGDRSAFLRFPYSGFSRTYSRTRYRTDSAAGGTALTTGKKVENEHVNWGPDSTRYATIFDDAVKAGMWTGFVVTSSVLDATPASTYAHVANRKAFDSISMQMAQCPFEVMIGGDRNSFLPENRKDGKAPIDTLKARGYDMLYSVLDLASTRSRKYCALLSDDNPPKATERGRMLTLGALKAIETLNRYDKGFVLMIEGSQIDWACHNNDSAYLVAEMEDFEDMLNAVLDFAERDGQTLVVVTADHETGGLTLLKGSIEEGVSRPTWATGGHSGVMVPVFSFGPGANLFSGVMQNTDFYGKLMLLMGAK